MRLVKNLLLQYDKSQVFAKWIEKGHSFHIIK